MKKNSISIERKGTCKMKLFKLNYRKAHEQIKRKKDLNSSFEEMLVQIHFHFRFLGFSFERLIHLELK